MKVILIKDYNLNGIIKKAGIELDVDKEHFKKLMKFKYIKSSETIKQVKKEQIKKINRRK